MGSALSPHKLLLTECGPSKMWVIIQELAKVGSADEATSLLHAVQGSGYAKHYQRHFGDTRRSRGRSLTVLAGKTTLSHQQQGADRVSKGQVKSTDDHT